MELKRRDQADDALGHQEGRLGQGVRRFELRSGELVQAAGASDYHPVFQEPRQGFRTDALLREVFEAQHSAGRKESHRTLALARRQPSM